MSLILVTNDDGIQSPGIDALTLALSELGQVVVVAPSRQQSAVSHKITLGEALRVRAVGAHRFAVTGTPADAVFLAVHTICERPPDLVVSGINLGVNLGTDLFYSGTVAGAIEGALKGIPAIAISQQLPHSPTTPPLEDEAAQKANWWDPLGNREALFPLLHCSARFAAALARQVLRERTAFGPVLNVNVPNHPTDGFSFTRVGGRSYRGAVMERVDPRGIPYYWIGGPADDADDPPGTDSWALAQGRISVSQLTLDWNTTGGNGSGVDIRGFCRHPS